MKTITFPSGTTEPVPTEAGEQCWCIALVKVEKGSLMATTVKGLTPEDTKANAEKALVNVKWAGEGSFCTLPFQVSSVLYDYGLGGLTGVLWSYSLKAQIPSEVLGEIKQEEE